MIADVPSCDWSAPGARRYTGTVAAAIASYHFPIATQAQLIEAFESRHFTDIVVIDRDSIRGAHEYKDLSRMHFGSGGRTCLHVDRSGWPADRAETAIVVCAGETCVAIPSVCLNVAILTRSPDRAGDDSPGERGLAGGGAEPVGEGESFAATIADQSGAALSAGAGPVMGTASVVDEARSGASPGWSAFASSSITTWGGAVLIAGPCCALCEVPGSVPAVPEPLQATMLLAGLASIAVWSRRSKS